MQVSADVKNAYTNQYDESMIEWRSVGAKYKAKNIVSLAKNIQFDKVLEVGCGEGSILHWLSLWHFSKNLYAIEISESGVEITKSKNIEHLREISIFDGYKIPYPDNHFDLVICSHVMEHVEHERVLLREIKRVSKHQIFEVPIDFSFNVDKKINHYLAYGHINIYTPALFRFLLKSENFEVKNDINYLFESEFMQLLFKNDKMGMLKMRLKQSVLRLFPYLLKIKPNFYTVLSSKSDKDISIF
jgi:ubiquinone/menaquinone biosynthesis C-methylase UbiE